MKAILLAAGSGNRLNSLTKNLPKSLIQINGVSLIERQLSILQKNNITDIAVIVGPNKNKFSLKSVTFVYDFAYDEHDQLGSLMSARSYMDDDLLIMFTDIIFDEEILCQLLQSRGENAAAVDTDWQKSYEERSDNPILDAGRVLISNNKIEQLSENIPIKKDAKNLGEFLGLVKLSKNDVKKLVNVYEQLEIKHVGNFHDASSLKEAKLMDILQELIIRGVEIEPVIVKGRWCEVDTKMDLLRAEKIFNEI